MMKRMPYCALGVFISVSSTGCSLLLDETWQWPYPRDQSTHGALALLNDKIFEKIDLALVLDPKGECNSTKDGRMRLECAFEAFYNGAEDDVLKLKRNRVQDRLVAASNQRCARYKRHVRRFDSTNNLLFGALTTSSAGLGAILTNVDAVRALSGAAAIASGVRAEINETYFGQSAIQAVSRGFEQRRKDLRKKMENEQTKLIEEYTVERAVADALVYHDACSLIAGLEEIARDQGRAANPGLAQIEDTLEWVGNIVEEMGDVVDPNRTEADSAPDTTPGF